MPSPGSELTALTAESRHRAKADLSDLVTVPSVAVPSVADPSVADPSVADPRRHPRGECHKTKRWVADACAKAGQRVVRLAETPTGGHALVGHRPTAPGAPTELPYCHDDVRPPLDDAARQTPAVHPHRTRRTPTRAGGGAVPARVRHRSAALTHTPGRLT
ncbi:hypothetical protein [Streptomyces sp. NPDC004685]